MPQYRLSICIPARNEEWLGRTIQDLLEHTSSELTQIIAVLDGYLPDPPLPNSDRVTIIYNPVAVGQRAACNQAVKISNTKYVMKIDAHCAVDDNFDEKVIKDMEELGDDTTLIPLMKNLHVFDWVCKNGHRRYQSPSGPCETCGEPTTKDVCWIAKTSPQNVAFRFDKTLHFQYWGEWQNKHPEDYVETLSIQGSCYMATREKYLELDLTSEEFNSWGQNGVEVACKTWLSGGKVVGTRKTWYAHCFRTRGGDFGFPYPNPQDKVNENREKSRELFQKDKWPLAKHSFQWLLDKFNPPDWGLTKGIIYYTDSQLDEKIAKPVRDKLLEISREKNINIVSSSLKKMDFGVKNVRFPSLTRGYLAMFKQIMAALENSKDDIIFFCEHDVLYSATHFDFTPERDDTFYYNQNVWLLRATDGHALHFDVNQLSGLCVYRDAALKHFRERYELAERMSKELDEVEFNKWVRHIGFEPFTHNRIKWQNQFKYDTWKSEYPNIDIKHGANATGARWKKEQYKNQSLLINWQETDDEISGWGKTSELIKQFN